MNVPLVTVRVNDETKARMERLESINWSDVIRDRIYEVLDREARKNRMEALRMMEKLSRKPEPGWDSTKFIRQMRDSRYGLRRRGR